MKAASKIRIQKVLSQAGVASRREIERWIVEGRIEINGQIAKPGVTVGEKDKIVVNGKLLVNVFPAQNEENTRILLYHKPIGEISSRKDIKHEKTVFDNLPRIKEGRWVQVGRLDLNTSGLLIFTNNGDLANRLMHPKYSVEREYAVRVYGQVHDEMIRTLCKGVLLDDGMAAFQRIEYRGGEGTNHWYHVVLCEGRNREVRRLWQSQGIEVSRLIRIRYGHIRLPRNLSRGQYVELSKSEVKKIIAVVG